MRAGNANIVFTRGTLVLQRNVSARALPSLPASSSKTRFEAAIALLISSSKSSRQTTDGDAGPLEREEEIKCEFPFHSTKEAPVSTQVTEPAGIEERLAELELQHHRLKTATWIAFCLSAACALVIVFLIFLDSGHRPLRASTIEIQNHPPALFIRLQDEHEVPVALVRNDYGKLKISLLADVVICDRDQNPRATLRVDKNGVHLTPINENRKSE